MDETLIAILRSGTPLVYVTLAGVFAWRAGIWHLGLEGLMIIGACATILGIVATGSIVLALAIAMVLCALTSVLFWFVVEKLKANQIIAGLGLTGLGLSGTTLAVEAIFGTQAAVSAPFGLATARTSVRAVRVAVDSCGTDAGRGVCRLVASVPNTLRPEAGSDR